MNVLKLSTIVLVLATSACAAQKVELPKELSGLCAIKPLGQSQGVMLAQVHCEAE